MKLDNSPFQLGTASAAGDVSVNYAPGTTTNPSNAKSQGNAETLPSTSATVRRRSQRKIESRVWMKSLT